MKELNMQTYLVGGAVRDTLLKRHVKDRDYVVVGASPEQMTNLGYKPVGKDFPVFLHPDTQDEYALARVERKVGEGYGGFSFDTNDTVTLEEDLSRRDLTINAMAMDDEGHIIDPFNGQKDLVQRIFRHVSPAFVEDPLRVLRIARFMARYHADGFTIAPDTMRLMKQIGNSGELGALSAPRVWQETALALSESSPQTYFLVLTQTSSLIPWFHDLSQSITAINTLAPAFVYAQSLRDKAMINMEEYLAIATTLITIKSAPDDVMRWTKRMPLPTLVQDCIALTHRHIDSLLRLETLSAEQLLELLNQCDIQRRPKRFSLIMLVLRCYEQASQITPNHKFLDEVVQAMTSVNVQDIISQGYQGAEIKTQLQLAQLAQITTLLNR